MADGPGTGLLGRVENTAAEEEIPLELIKIASEKQKIQKRQLEIIGSLPAHFRELRPILGGQEFKKHYTRLIDAIQNLISQLVKDSLPIAAKEVRILIQRWDALASDIGMTITGNILGNKRGLGALTSTIREEFYTLNGLIKKELDLTIKQSELKGQLDKIFARDGVQPAGVR